MVTESQILSLLSLPYSHGNQELESTGQYLSEAPLTLQEFQDIPHVPGVTPYGASRKQEIRKSSHALHQKEGLLHNREQLNVIQLPDCLH